MGEGHVVNDDDDAKKKKNPAVKRAKGTAAAGENDGANNDNQ